MADEQKQPARGADAGEAESQKLADEANEKGFIGVEVDQTPNEEYSMERPGSWKTPEADEGAARKAGAARAAGKFGSKEEK